MYKLEHPAAEAACCEHVRTQEEGLSSSHIVRETRVSECTCRYGVREMGASLRLSVDTDSERGEDGEGGGELHLD